MNFRKLIVPFVFALGLTTGVHALDPTAVARDPAGDEAMKKGKPTEEHKVFDNFVGKWTCKIRDRIAPGDEFQFSLATSENIITMDNRFLRQMMSGDWAGVMFEGEGLIGYDNIRGEYQLVWIDNLANGMMGAVGTYDPSTRTLRFTGDYSSPLTGEKARWFRAEWKVVDANSNVYTAYNQGPDGKEFEARQMIYTRVP